MLSPSPPETIVNNRFLGFLIWQSISSTTIFFLFKSFFSTPLTNPTFTSFLTFLSFNFSHLIFSSALSVISSPELTRPASPFQLAFRPSPSLRRRALLSLKFLLFVTASSVSAFVSVLSICWGSYVDNVNFVGKVGAMAFTFGLVYGLFYIHKQRWLLEFPTIQRPPFFVFKRGVPAAIVRTLKLSWALYLVSALVLVFIPGQPKSQVTVGNFVAVQIIFYISSFAVLLCWEVTHHIHQVLLTKRFNFAPPKGSAAAETNPSEPLLAVLEQSTPGSLLQYLGYLDLFMVCQNNANTWRRAAFFEETSEIYKKVVTVCLRPLEQLASKLNEFLEGSSTEKVYNASSQLLLQTEAPLDATLNNFQLYAWCAQTAASLTARSLKEDRCGVAQVSGSNAAVVSTLLSCLLAVETIMGKKTVMQASNYLMGPAGIKWATSNIGTKDVKTPKRKGEGSDILKAYKIADVLRVSIYSIVHAFHNEMLISAKAGNLDKNWIPDAKPIYGTREMLVNQLSLFVDGQAI